MNENEWTSMLEAGGAPFLDRAVGAAIASYAKRHPTVEGLPARLEEIERAIAAKDAALRAEELKHLGFRKATQAGIPPELLENFNLTDEAAIDAKISQLTEAVAERRQADITKAILQGGHQPGSGGVPSPGPSTLAEHMQQADRRLRHG